MLFLLLQYPRVLAIHIHQQQRIYKQCKLKLEGRVNLLCQTCPLSQQYVTIMSSFFRQKKIMVNATCSETYSAQKCYQSFLLSFHQNGWTKHKAF